MRILRRVIAILSFIVLLCAPTARAGTYFEYAPDPWRSYRLAVSTVATPYQFFQSASDFTLTGFSFWVDNTGSSGPVTFTLLDDENSTLAEKTVTLSHFAAIPGGTRLRVTLDEPVEISHYQTYSIQISSTLLGFGLYYANRINILEHNLQYTTEYALGVAQLGSEKQNYTFKFALEDPTDGSGGGEETITESEPEIPAASSTVFIGTVISNARMVDIAATTARAAWTTNIAADSRVAVRTQLNPLYVYKTAYDATLELEHSLALSGLMPETHYFVDFFSQQSADEPILTTYTVAFTTGALTPEEEAAAQAATTTPSTTATTTTATDEPAAQAATTTSATASLSAVTFGAGNGTDSFSVNWETPASGAPNGGYRIDIFDDQHRLIRQLRAPADATSRTVAILPPGEHEVIVYADRDGVYEKVAAPTLFEAKKSRSPLFWFWYLIGVVLSVGIGLAFLFSRREKTELPKLE